MRFRAKCLIGATLLSLAGAIAWTCAGPVEAPTWSVDKADYDPYGSGAILSPANDTRANLLMLLSDRQGVPMRSNGAKAYDIPLVMIPWKLMEGQAQGVDPNDYNRFSTDYPNAQYAMSRCQTFPAGAADFREAVNASKASSADKAALAAARDGMTVDCDKGQAVVASPPVSSVVGRAYATYLQGASFFYAGRFDDAAASFTSLAKAEDPWVRETALYMVARNALNKAIEQSMGDYGDLAQPAKRDKAGAQAAGAAFLSYIKAYPGGRYAGSAEGLLRRAAWLAGDGDALAAMYDRALPEVRTAGDATSMIDEIDYKLGMDHPTARSRSALLRAVQDLQQMRGSRIYDDGGSGDEPSLTKAELDAQAPIFKGESALYGYLQAAHAFWVRKDAKAALALIPDAAHQKRFTYLEFSRQMLRGLALDAMKDRNARGFWLSLFPGAVQPYQRGAVELALATHDERSGQPGAVFAAGSPVTHPVMRDLLLEFTAGPALLRQQMRSGVSPHERKVAHYILLAKELQRGFYKEFVAESATIQRGKGEEGGYWGAQYYNTTYNETLADPPLSRFLAGPNAEAGCPTVRDIALSLAADPQGVRPRLCLAEFFRTQGFDNFEFDVAPEWSGLGQGPSQFPGKPYVRMATYQSVLANPKASADDKAFALNRMVRCYAPSGYSSCGDTQVEQSVRKSWYDRLKRDYPASRWAKDLRYYW